MSGLRANAFTREVKELFTDTINCYVKEESEKLSVFQQGGVYLATKENRKNNPKAAGDTGRQCGKAGMESDGRCSIG